MSRLWLASASAGVLAMAGFHRESGTAAGFSSSVAAIAPANVVCTASSVATVFSSEPLTRVLLVKSFAKGEELSLGGKSAGKAANELCMVKLLVGPGTAGPAGAPSTQNGIGIEIWLPSPVNWTGRIHNLGGGGFAGLREISSTTEISPGLVSSAYGVAGSEGAVSATTDTGHVSPGSFLEAGLDGSFLMNPDGTINRAQWADYAGRGVHEMSVKSKTLAAAYYGHPAHYAYFDGCSAGGRQAHKEAQDFPGDYDGILAGDGALNWTSMRTGSIYPQIVFAQDLGGVPISPKQLDFVSSAAVSACDTDLNGRHAGYISDPESCHYDPAKDPDVLCKSDSGRNTTALCVTRKQASVINKIWYGQTADGSAPDPAFANGASSSLAKGQLWFGVLRGNQLALQTVPAMGVAASSDGVPVPFKLGTHQVALNLQNPALADPTFHNMSGNGNNGWARMSYADLARSTQQGYALQTAFAHINTDQADLSRFRARNGKMLYYHGMADPLIPMQGSTHYYQAVMAKMGGAKAVRKFYRYFQVPGLGHCFGIGSVNGLAGVSPQADPPLPAPGQLYERLVAWVEKGRAPRNVILRNAAGTTTRPLCAFPQKLKYLGGDRDVARSYTCS